MQIQLRHFDPGCQPQSFAAYPLMVNRKIGGVPEIYYYDFESKGRGQVVRLLCEDAGIAYRDIRMTMAEYPEWKQDVLSKMNPVGNIPVVELNGKILTQSYSILRYFARTLNAYDGSTSEEKYRVDVLCDVAADWRAILVDSFFAQDQGESWAKYCTEKLPHFLNALNVLLGGSDWPKPGQKVLGVHDTQQDGPFVLGRAVSYADLFIYQICHDDGLTKDDYEPLVDHIAIKDLCEAVERRPNVIAFMKSERYLG